jgi:hypothetical protein
MQLQSLGTQNIPVYENVHFFVSLLSRDFKLDGAHTKNLIQIYINLKDKLETYQTITALHN